MIGVDIVSIQRVEKFVSKFGDKALDRFLNESEKKVAHKIESVAGLWAAKEAISKSIGTGIGKGLGFHDICISKDKKGKPFFTIKNSKIPNSSLSISHDGGFAIAVAIILPRS